MKRLYFVKTNAYDMLVTVEGSEVRYLIENEYTNFPKEKDYGFQDDFMVKLTEYEKAVKEYLINEVEDNSSWETDVSLEEMFDIMDVCEIVAEIEKEI